MSTVTPSQTIGPFFSNCLLRPGALCNTLVGDDTAGERIRIVGRVLDGDAQPVPDALVEIWQANSFGRYNHPADARDLPLDPNFTGYGRSGTDEGGGFWFDTIRPGAVPFADQQQAPHISLTIFARGLLNHLLTRLYFADDPATAADPILALVPTARRSTLLARRDEQGVYSFDIVLQGAAETVFFNL